MLGVPTGGTSGDIIRPSGSKPPSSLRSARRVVAPPPPAPLSQEEPGTARAGARPPAWILRVPPSSHTLSAIASPLATLIASQSSVPHELL
jgi:hypothetical protein